MSSIRRVTMGWACSLAVLVACESDPPAAPPDGGEPRDAVVSDGSAADALESHPDATPHPDASVAQDAEAWKDASGPGTDAGTTPALWQPFAVLSLNLHCLKTDGTPYATNAERFSAIAGLAAAENVAVILAQEVCERPGASARVELTAALEAATSTTWSSEWGYAHEAWSGTPDAAREGLAIFARGRLSTPRVVAYKAQGPLRRVMVTAVLPPSLGSLTAHSVHLDHLSAGVRAAQAAETASYALAAADPSLSLLVAGDFNDVAGSAPHGMLLQMGFRDLSSSLDPGRIDHVWLHRGAGASATGQRLTFDGTREPRVSDHPGVLVELAPTQAPALRPTRIVATAGWTGYLSVRGSEAPLSWDRGWLAWPDGQNSWKLVFTELSAATFAYKWLRDDSTYQQGADLSGRSGEDNRSTPGF